jgi:hypothetical protein
VNFILAVRRFDPRDHQLGYPTCHSMANWPLHPIHKGHIQNVIDRLLGETLHTVTLGGREFVTGSIADLPLLLPEVTPTTRSGVYVPLHPGMLPVNSRSH